MEVLLRYGTAEQKKQWLDPLLDGEIRSAFCMTEPDVASSDATNMAATAIVDGDEVVINGRKWWSTGIGHPDCELLIFMGLTDPDAPPVRAAHDGAGPARHPRREGRAPAAGDGPVRRAARPRRGDASPTSGCRSRNILVGPGRAFEIAQGRLGPGRVHHCMRLIGLAEKALELALPARRPAGPRSASRWSTSAATASGSRTPGSRSTRPGCWCCRRRTCWTPRGLPVRSAR